MSVLDALRAERARLAAEIARVDAAIAAYSEKPAAPVRLVPPPAKGAYGAKTEQVRRYLAEHPWSTGGEIEQALGPWARIAVHHMPDVQVRLGKNTGPSRGRFPEVRQYALATSEQHGAGGVFPRAKVQS